MSFNDWYCIVGCLFRRWCRRLIAFCAIQCLAFGGMEMPLSMARSQESGASPLSTPSSGVRADSFLFHQQAQQGTGLLIPLYVYPANVHTHADFNRVIQLKRQYERIPFWVILNPASGPGESRDPNYTKAIDRLSGAGCVVLGYVSTAYGKRPVDEVTGDLARWRELYPKIQGVFFDEMNYEGTASSIAHQKYLSQKAREAEYWPIACNPGADTPEGYFKEQLADTIVVHEGAEWPEEKRLHGDYFGGYADYPPWRRAVLMHSVPRLDKERIRMIRQYVRWIYVTDDLFRAGDAKQPNPWDSIPSYLEELCQILASG